MPAGPEPTTAARLPVGAWGRVWGRWAVASPSQRSIERIDTDPSSVVTARLHTSWQVWGQTRPVMRGNGLCSANDRTASSRRPVVIRWRYTGMATPAGHPAEHGAVRSVSTGRTLRHAPVLSAVAVDASETGISG